MLLTFSRRRLLASCPRWAFFCFLTCSFILQTKDKGAPALDKLTPLDFFLQLLSPPKKQKTCETCPRGPCEFSCRSQCEARIAYRSASTTRRVCLEPCGGLVGDSAAASLAEAPGLDCPGAPTSANNARERAYACGNNACFDRDGRTWLEESGWRGSSEREGVLFFFLGGEGGVTLPQTITRLLKTWSSRCLCSTSRCLVSGRTSRC